MNSKENPMFGKLVTTSDGCFVLVLDSPPNGSPNAELVSRLSSPAVGANKIKLYPTNVDVGILKQNVSNAYLTEKIGPLGTDISKTSVTNSDVSRVVEDCVVSKTSASEKSSTVTIIDTRKTTLTDPGVSTRKQNIVVTEANKGTKTVPDVIILDTKQIPSTNTGVSIVKKNIAEAQACARTVPVAGSLKLDDGRQTLLTNTTVNIAQQNSVVTKANVSSKTSPVETEWLNSPIVISYSSSSAAKSTTSLSNSNTEVAKCLQSSAVTQPSKLTLSVSLLNKKYNTSTTKPIIVTPNINDKPAIQSSAYVINHVSKCAPVKAGDSGTQMCMQTSMKENETSNIMKVVYPLVVNTSGLQNEVKKVVKSINSEQTHNVNSTPHSVVSNVVPSKLFSHTAAAKMIPTTSVTVTTSSSVPSHSYASSTPKTIPASPVIPQTCTTSLATPKTGPPSLPLPTTDRSPLVIPQTRLSSLLTPLAGLTSLLKTLPPIPRPNSPPVIVPVTRSESHVKPRKRSVTPILPRTLSVSIPANTILSSLSTKLNLCTANPKIVIAASNTNPKIVFAASKTTVSTTTAAMQASNVTSANINKSNAPTSVVMRVLPVGSNANPKIDLAASNTNPKIVFAASKSTVSTTTAAMQASNVTSANINKSNAPTSVVMRVLPDVGSNGQALPPTVIVTLPVSHNGTAVASELQSASSENKNNLTVTSQPLTPSSCASGIVSSSKAIERVAKPAECYVMTPSFPLGLKWSTIGKPVSKNDITSAKYTAAVGTSPIKLKIDSVFSLSNTKSDITDTKKGEEFARALASSAVKIVSTVATNSISDKSLEDVLDPCYPVLEKLSEKQIAYLKLSALRKKSATTRMLRKRKGSQFDSDAVLERKCSSYCRQRTLNFLCGLGMLKCKKAKHNESKTAQLDGKASEQVKVDGKTSQTSMDNQPENSNITSRLFAISPVTSDTASSHSLSSGIKIQPSVSVVKAITTGESKKSIQPSVTIVKDTLTTGESNKSTQPSVSVVEPMTTGEMKKSIQPSVSIVKGPMTTGEMKKLIQPSVSVVKEPMTTGESKKSIQPSVSVVKGPMTTGESKKSIQPSVSIVKGPMTTGEMKKSIQPSVSVVKGPMTTGEMKKSIQPSVSVVKEPMTTEQSKKSIQPSVSVVKGPMTTGEMKKSIQPSVSVVKEPMTTEQSKKSIQPSVSVVKGPMTTGESKKSIQPSVSVVKGAMTTEQSKRLIQTSVSVVKGEMTIEQSKKSGITHLQLLYVNNKLCLVPMQNNTDTSRSTGTSISRPNKDENVRTSTPNIPPTIVIYNSAAPSHSARFIPSFQPPNVLNNPDCAIKASTSTTRCDNGQRSIITCVSPSATSTPHARTISLLKSRLQVDPLGPCTVVQVPSNPGTVSAVAQRPTEPRTISFLNQEPILTVAKKPKLIISPEVKKIMNIKEKRVEPWKLPWNYEIKPEPVTEGYGDEDDGKTSGNVNNTSSDNHAPSSVTNTSSLIHSSVARAEPINDDIGNVSPVTYLTQPHLPFKLSKTSESFPEGTTQESRIERLKEILREKERQLDDLKRKNSFASLLHNNE